MAPLDDCRASRLRVDCFRRVFANPLNDGDLAEFVKLQKKRVDSPQSWTVNTSDLDPATFDLSVKNPNGNEAVVHRSPREILNEIAQLDAESAEVLGRIRGLV